MSLSILDLAFISETSNASATFQSSVILAQHAERWGYKRYWFAEHHNMPTIGSSSPGILIAFIAAHTQNIRVGSGGIMLPNHSPLTIAEQFGTLEALYPGRIDLGLGRAPGGDQKTFAALRRDPRSAEYFPQDVIELRKLLGPLQENQDVQAIPGTGLNVPLYILGSSLFGARLAATLGLPYAFASHFAPDELEPALEIYRNEFKASEQLKQPYVIAGLNVFAADTSQKAEELFTDCLRRFSLSLLKRTGAHLPTISDDQLLSSPAGQHARHMLHFTALGDPSEINKSIDRFLRLTQADELMVVTNVVDPFARLRSYEILAESQTHS